MSILLVHPDVKLTPAEVWTKALSRFEEAVGTAFTREARVALGQQLRELSAAARPLDRDAAKGLVFAAACIEHNARGDDPSKH